MKPLVMTLLSILLFSWHTNGALAQSRLLRGDQNVLPRVPTHDTPVQHRFPRGVDRLEFLLPENSLMSFPGHASPLPEELRRVQPHVDNSPVRISRGAFDKYLAGWTSQSSTGGSWQNAFRVSYTVNWLTDTTISGSADSAVAAGYAGLKWEFGGWTKQYRMVYLYDSTGRCNESVYQTWSGEKWVDQSRVRTSRNAQQLPDTTTTQTWNGYSWKDSQRSIAEYDAQGRASRYLYQVCNTSVWVNSSKAEVTYASANAYSSYVIFTWTDGKWDYSSRYDWTYTLTSLVQEYLHREWDADSSRWDNVDRTLTLYLGNTSEAESQIWFDGDWAPQGRILGTYADATFTKPLSGLQQNRVDTTWVDESRTFYSYDSDMYLLEYLLQRKVGDTWENETRLQNTYGSPAGLLAPKKNEVWIIGEQDTICWSDDSTDKALDIEFSTDDGDTYESIDEGIPMDSCQYEWEIPDTIFSAKCRIRLLDASTDLTFSESQRFGIKRYVLTRIDSASGDFVPYDSSLHRWGFWNEESQIWPWLWYDRFDYTGIDSITGLPYSQWQGDSTFFYASYDEHPDWESFVKTFSVGACYWNVRMGSYVYTALKRWESAKRVWAGSCYGIAASNALAFMHQERFQNKFPSFPPITTNPVDITADSTETAVKPVVSELFTHQFGKAAITNDITGEARTANETLRDLKKLFKTSEEIRTLTMVNNNGPGAHTILAYGLKQDPAASNQYLVYVYDNSFPTRLDATIRIDTMAFGNTGSWEPLYGWTNWGGNTMLYLEPPSDGYLNFSQLAKRSGTASPFKLAGTQMELYSRGCDITLRDSASGQVTGYADGQLLDNLPGAHPFLRKNGSADPPYGYSVPRGAYTITMDMFTSPDVRLTVFHENKTYAYRRAGGTVGQTDRVYVTQNVSDAPAFTVVNPDSASRSVTLSNIILESAQEKMFTVRNLGMGRHDSLQMVNEDGDHVKIVSYGTAKTYTLELNQASEFTLGRFVASGVPLAASTTHRLVPDWTDISRAPLTIFVDEGNDGSVDDTLHVQNEVTGTETHGSLVPEECRLYQNYPNPFNPVTTIRYALPQRSTVRLSVYNLLGQEVAVLVREEQEAGYHEVSFNGSALASGVYICRLQAGHFVQTRKLLLVR